MDGNSKETQGPNKKNVEIVGRSRYGDLVYLNSFPPSWEPDSPDTLLIRKKIARSVQKDRMGHLSMFEQIGPSLNGVVIQKPEIKEKKSWEDFDLYISGKGMGHQEIIAVALKDPSHLARIEDDYLKFDLLYQRYRGKKLVIAQLRNWGVGTHAEEALEALLRRSHVSYYFLNSNESFQPNKYI